MIKSIVFILLFFFAWATPAKAQFTESKERKKMWRKSFKRRKARQSFNPYLDKKNKPSGDLNKANARELKKQNRAARKQKKKSMKKLGIKATKVKKA